MHNNNDNCIKCKISHFLLSTQQFSKYLENAFPMSLQYDHKNIFYQLNGIIHTDYFDMFINNLLHSSEEKIKKKNFQRFLINKCHLLKIDIIYLDNIEETCQTFERQSILILSILYYFT